MGRRIWCRCDAGPHGFLSIAGHAHADALSIEVRLDGTEVLADPGTYCYHGEPEWRAYFRSTVAHNTLEVAGQDQSVSGGPFLWARHAEARLRDLIDDPDGVQQWSAEHHGYRRLAPPAVHERAVRLDSARRRVEIVDRIRAGGRHPYRLAFHLGPAIDARLEESVAQLSWSTEHGPKTATLALPPDLRWSAYRGSTEPRAGWYSPAFGERRPTITLLGTGVSSSDMGELRTVLEFSGFPSEQRESCDSVHGTSQYER